MMCQTRRMTKTMKNMRPRSHQSYMLWSQELSLRGIKTSPLLLPRWPIRNLYLQYRSCPRLTTSTSTSTNPGSEPYTTLDHLGPPAQGQDHTTPNTCSGCQGSLAVKHSVRPPSACACKCPVSTRIMTYVPLPVFTCRSLQH